jgi:hypothetical protein
MIEVLAAHLFSIKSRNSGNQSWIQSAVELPPFARRPPNLLPFRENGEDKYQLFEDTWIIIHGELLEAKAGTIVDGASVPRAAWWFTPPDGPHRLAAFWHDVLYSTHQLPKEVADSIFLELMLESGVPRGRARTMYLAVKWFGGPAWRKGTGVLNWAPLKFNYEMT